MAIILLSIAGWTLYSTIERSLQKKLASDLQTVLDADLAALDLWLISQENNVADAAAEPQMQQAVRTLIETHKSDASTAPLINSPAQAVIRQHMQQTFSSRGYIGCLVIDRDGTALASFREELIGKNVKNLYEHRDFIDAALAGKPSISRPLPSATMLPDKHGRLRAGLPTMFAAAPVRLSESTIDAALLLRIPPDTDFTRILNVARIGETGETYAFDRQGVMLSSSRFNDQLKQIGLIPDNDDADSILAMQIRDPQVDLTKGERPTAGKRPLTAMAAEAIAGRDGVNVAGYRDYRGVPVVGAWRWLPKYQMGVVTEVDRAEAYEALFILRTTFAILFALLVVAAIGLLVAMLILARVRLALRKANIESGRLGQYVLEEKLGEGGMGAVYKARHAFLRRPTAIKLLKPEAVTNDSIARFEREVQLTSTLNHPNTVAVYDYGRTAEGVFYYAMEYLDGISLDALVKQYGPQQPSRVIYILRQICGSLAEAHEAGLIHRDIKPANVLINCRAGMCDVVKVLDFGLVKSTQQHDVTLTVASHIVGTPQYISPEGICDAVAVDTRSDLYAVGAVGYFLLTGRPVFDGPGIMDLCRQHLEEFPQPPSKYAPALISPELDEVILKCLAKDKADRPQSSRELDELLGAAESGDWTQALAQRWWLQRQSSTLAKGIIQFEPPAAETIFLQATDQSTKVER